MKVKELIEELSKFNPELDVIMLNYGGEYSMDDYKYIPVESLVYKTKKDGYNYYSTSDKRVKYYKRVVIL